MNEWSGLSVCEREGREREPGSCYRTDGWVWECV